MALTRSYLNAFVACTDEAFFECGAVELAQKLLGKCLYCHQSGILLRIIETEAFPYGDAVYQKVFAIGGATLELPCKAGQLVALSATLFNKLKNSQAVDPDDYLYVTARANDSGENSRDLVLLRSCEPHAQGERRTSYSYMAQLEDRVRVRESSSNYVKKSLVIFPYTVALALKGDWEDSPALYEKFGVQLYVWRGENSNRLVAGYSEAMLHSPRVLSKAMFKQEFDQDPPTGGVLEKYRFALQTKNNYRYALPESLQKMEPSSLVDLSSIVTDN